MDKSINKILSAIDVAISKFQESVPGIQKLVYEELQPLIKQIEIKNGRLLNNLNNLKLIGTLQNKLEKIIVNSQYKQSVNDFIQSFTEVSNLNNEYFSKFNKKLKTKNTLPIIKQLAVEATINDLVGQGMKSSIIDPIQKILNQNITTGGNYARFQDQLRNHILTNETGEGSMERYTKQITTDAINQYNAQYHDAIAQDLNFNWGRYIGSNINTSREFCVYLTKKQWVKRSELPEILKGNIDGHQCKLGKTTKLPIGMIPGTTVDNFKILRGGYNCGHQFFWVPDSAVPENIKNNKGPLTPEHVIVATAALAAGLHSGSSQLQKIKEDNKTTLQEFADKGIVFYDDIAEHFDKDTKFVFTKDEGSNYFPPTKTLTIQNSKRLDNPYYLAKIMAHEGGHAMHFEKGIITFDKVDPDFLEFYKKAQLIIKGKESDFDDQLQSIARKNFSDKNLIEQFGVYYDTLGGLTGGDFGGGHNKSYYPSGNKGMMEVFAHAMTMLKVPDSIGDMNETAKELRELMVEYASQVLK